MIEESLVFYLNQIVLLTRPISVRLHVQLPVPTQLVPEPAQLKAADVTVIWWRLVMRAVRFQQLVHVMMMTEHQDLYVNISLCYAFKIQISPESGLVCQIIQESLKWDDNNQKS